MRTLFITALFLAACSGAAQSETRYDLYIFQARDGGAKIYAFAGGNAAAALEVRGCGDVELLPNAAAVASEISARRRAPDVASSPSKRAVRASSSTIAAFKRKATMFTSMTKTASS